MFGSNLLRKHLHRHLERALSNLGISQFNEVDDQDEPPQKVTLKRLISSFVSFFPFSCLFYL